MATHASVLAWSIPGTEEPGGLPSAGSHRVGHDGSGLARQRLSASKMAASGRRRLALTACLLPSSISLLWVCVTNCSWQIR